MTGWPRLRANKRDDGFDILRLVRGFLTGLEHRLKRFMDHAAQHRLKRAMPLHMLPEGIVDKCLVIAAALLVNALLKPSQDVLIQANRNARLMGPIPTFVSPAAK